MPLIQSIIHLTNRYCIYCTTTTTMDETISSNSTLAPNEEASTINWDVHIEEMIVFRRVRKAIFSGVANNESNDETNDESNDEETNISSPGQRPPADQKKQLEDLKDHLEMSKAEVQNLQTSLDDTTSSKLPRDQDSGLVNDDETNINRNNPQQQTFVSNEVNNNHYSNTIEMGRQG